MNDCNNSSQCENEEDDDELEAEIVVKKSRILEQLDDSDDDELVTTSMGNSLSNIFETQNGIYKTSFFIILKKCFKNFF